MIITHNSLASHDIVVFLVRFVVVAKDVSFGVAIRCLFVEFFLWWQRKVLLFSQHLMQQRCALCLLSSRNRICLGSLQILKDTTAMDVIATVWTERS